MLRQTTFLILFFLLILSACDNDDQNSQKDLASLPFIANNIEGDWKRIAEFRGQPSDSLGILEPTEDLFSQFENCRKDDMIRYVKATQQEKNVYFWGTGEVACHSQIANVFSKIGTWTLEESGKLSHFYSDVSVIYIVVILRNQQLLVRKQLGKEEPDGVIYEFTEYVRSK